MLSCKSKVIYTKGFEKKVNISGLDTSIRYKFDVFPPYCKRMATNKCATKYEFVTFCSCTDECFDFGRVKQRLLLTQKGIEQIFNKNPVSLPVKCIWEILYVEIYNHNRYYSDSFYHYRYQLVTFDSVSPYAVNNKFKLMKGKIMERYYYVNISKSNTNIVEVVLDTTTREERIFILKHRDVKGASIVFEENGSRLFTIIGMEGRLCKDNIEGFKKLLNYNAPIIEYEDKLDFNKFKIK
jgi:hypothetical protein